ncbi:hypothetical protein RCZ04_18830 [Capnocytophaga sp. HP1101]
MKIEFIERIKLTQELIDREHYFTIGYCEAIETHLMEVLTPWIVGYNRYFRISANDYNLYQNDPQAFCKLYEKEINMSGECFSEKFIGADALRDYDGRNGFQYAFPTKELNPFGYHIYYKGVLYARILWDKGTVYVPPYQKVKTPNGDWDYPLRKNCYVEKDPQGKDLCFCLDIEREFNPNFKD